MTPSAGRFAQALNAIEQANAADPHTLTLEGACQPYELGYARRLLAWVLRLRPEASETLRLAAAGQHLERWKTPRSASPMTRAGYLRWRENLKKFHAQRLGEVLTAAGYRADEIAAVQSLVLKQRPLSDPEMQALEDALCLIFLELQLAELQAKTPADKMVDVLRKAWQKMSPQGRALAQQLPLAPEGQALIARALSPACE